MAYVHPDWVEHQRRRFMRPDAQRYWRPDAERLMPRETLKALGWQDPHETRSAAQQPSPRNDWAGFKSEREWLQYRHDVAKLRLDWEVFKLWLKARKALHPSNFQPRVPAGNPDGGEWTRVAGPGGGRGGRFGGYFPGATYSQLVRLDQATARTRDALEKLRQYEPNWQPRTTSQLAPRSIEGEIRHAEARAAETEARLEQVRSGIGGNRGPQLDPTPRPGRGSLPGPTFDGESWINAYRTTNNMPDLFGHPMWRDDKGTVAVTEFDGKLIFGVNSTAPGYTDAEHEAARRTRNLLTEKYDLPSGARRGEKPNDSFFHAESTILFRAAKENGGTLAGRTLNVQTDRDLCDSCEKILPLIGANLGHPTVTFTNYRNGWRWLLEGGQVRRIK